MPWIHVPSFRTIACPFICVMMHCTGYPLYGGLKVVNAQDNPNSSSGPIRYTTRI